MSVSRARPCVLIALLYLSMQIGFAQDVAAEKPFVPASRWALVIGASAYKQEVGPLKYTSKEAREFATHLKNNLGFHEENVTLLADGGEAEESPTSPHILTALDNLLSNPRLDKGNLFLFYFSGHGVGTANGDFLLPSDVSKDRIEEMGVPVKAVIERIVRAGLKNVLFITDACRSGEANEFGGQFIELCRQSNLAVILGCAPGKRSYEYPRLKRGPFTHFLIESLQDTKLRDESGTLWASKLGASIKKQVYDYTEPDYGKFAQDPALWGEQSTLDVLLATYPQKPVSDLAIESFKKSAEKLNKAEFAAAMTEYAAQLQLADRYDQSVEILKAVEQLGELTPVGRFLLGCSLNLVGRTGEGSKVFASFESEPESYYKDLALVSTKSRAVAPAVRISAATRMIERGSTWTDKMLASLVVDSVGTYEQQLHFAKRLAALASEPRQKLYARARLADKQGRWNDAIAAYEQALKTPGELPKNREIFIGLLSPTLALNDPRAMDRWVERGTNLPGCELTAYIERAFFAKERGDEHTRLASLQKIFSLNPDPDQIWQSVTLAGAHIGQLKQQIQRAAEEHPYSWKARLIVALMKQLNGDPSAMNDMNGSVLYRDDALSFAADTCNLMNTLIEEGARLGKISELDYRRQVELYFLGLLGSAPDFGYDSGLWLQLMSYGLLNERNTQVQFVLSKNIPFKPEDVPKNLRSLLLLNAMNIGDWPMVKKLNAVAYEPAEGDDPNWFYAAYLTTTGQEPAARVLTARLRTASERIAPRMEAMKTYLLANAGMKSEALKRLKNPIDDLVVRGFHGLAYAALSDWKKAEPLLLEQAQSRNWAFLFVSARGMKVLDDHYRKTGNTAGIRKLAYAAASAQPANPLFKGFTFAAKPGIAQFAGKISMACVIQDDVQNARVLSEGGEKVFAFGQLSLSVDQAGKVAGAFSDQKNNVYPFAGAIDPLGNFRGSANLSGRKFQVSAKLAPPPLYKKMPEFKTLGQIIEFVDSAGYRVAVIGHA
jgi:uncharacterized caspase-like protein